MPRDPRKLPGVMCLTQDGLGLAHAEQAARLCAAGAKWIQLRMKGAPLERWLEEARAVAEICRRHGTLLIINDSVDVALASGADGVHLGGMDGDWRQARKRLGPGRLIGGSINYPQDARRAAESGCLDYVGVGPYRFTSTKKDLSPLLGSDGVRALLGALGAIPAWVIGGVEPSDLPLLRALGASGVAVSSSLYRGDRIEENLRSFLDSWERPPAPASNPSPS